jgi:hypothetical protein
VCDVCLPEVYTVTAPPAHPLTPPSPPPSVPSPVSIPAPPRTHARTCTTVPNARERAQIKGVSITRKAFSETTARVFDRPDR